MLQKILLVGMLLGAFSTFAQVTDSAAMRNIQTWQQKMNDDYVNAESPLEEAQKEQFQGHDFYPIDLKYRVTAKVVRTPDAKSFYMPTTTERKAVYKCYAELHFTIDSVAYKLLVYESPDLRKMAKYEDYLFLPFYDLTNSVNTYGGGRFLDLKIPKGDEMIIDFNKSYNPYCAYSDRFSCPIPPKENTLNVPIKAGIRWVNEH